MAEEAIADDVIVGNGAEETTVQEIDYKAEFERLSKENEDKLSVIDKYKKDIAGLDRKVGELTEAQKELLKQTETAEETAQREALDRQQAWENKQNELATKETDLRSKENALNVKLKATELGINLSEVAKLKLNSVEQLEAYKELKDSLINATTETVTTNINKDLSGLPRDTYKTEGSSSTGFPSAIERALKR